VQELKKQLQEQVKGVWNLQEVQILERSLKDGTFRPFLKYLSNLNELVDKEIHKARSWDHYNFLRGQHDVLQRIFKIPDELEYIKEALKQDVNNIDAAT
jgi:hypothetical protein